MNATSDDERAIRALVGAWLAATAAGDLPKVLGLMADDVVFMAPGQEPFGKEEFTSRSRQTKDLRFEGKSEVVEIRVLGEWAWSRTRITVTITPPAGKPMRRSGFAMTILQKKPDGAWVIARDANMLAPE